MDASRSTEAAPVGLQRVEDYGARERRELQANVFGREFVLPRALVRRLHVDEGLGAVAITARTGLPIALVRQQLFDALLLPEAELAAAESSPVYVPRPDPSPDRASSPRCPPYLPHTGPATKDVARG